MTYSWKNWLPASSGSTPSTKASQFLLRFIGPMKLCRIFSWKLIRIERTKKLGMYKQTGSDHVQAVCYLYGRVQPSQAGFEGKIRDAAGLRG